MQLPIQSKNKVASVRMVIIALLIQNVSYYLSFFFILFFILISTSAKTTHVKVL